MISLWEHLRRYSAFLGLLWCGLAAGASLNAQVLSSNALTVKLIDPIDSAQGSAGQRFHAVIAKDTAIAGVFLAKGSDATITLVPGTGGSRWTLNLIEVTVNGKVVGVFGQNPAVVPTSAGDFFSMSRKTASTKDRIAVAAGENIRFTLGPANGAAAPPAVAGNPASTPTRGNVPTSVAPQDPSAAYRNAKVAGPRPGDNTFIGPFGSVLYGKYLHIEVRLDGCARQGTATATCDFSIWDRNPLEMIDMRIGAFALIDNKGQGIGLTGDGAKCCEGRNQSMIVPGVVSHAHYTYSGLDPDVTSIARVSIKVGEAGSGGNDDFEFRDVPLGQAATQVQEFTPTPKLPQKLVADDNGWRFTVLRCSPLARKSDPDFNVVECFIKIENLKADRDIKPWTSNFFVDDLGRTHDSVWFPYGAANGRANVTPSTGTIGDEATYARTGPIPEFADFRYGLDTKIYPAQPDVKYGEPRIVFAAYSVIPKDVKHIAHLEYSFRQDSEFRNFSVSFDDIDLTPMPATKAAPPAVKKPH
jgi:hypothetical protein